MSLTLTILDEVNCHIEGLTRQDIEEIVGATELPDKSAFMTAAFQTGNWNGKISMFDAETCIFFQHMLDTVTDVLEYRGYDLDSINIVDERTNRELKFDDLEFVDDHYFGDLLPWPLRAHQTNGINRAIADTKGILEYGTSSGKTVLGAGICRVFESKLKTITATPSASLVKQTAAQYEELGLDVKALTPSIKTEKKRKAVFENHRHIVLTPKLLMNCAGMFDSKDYVIILDEVHQIMGDEFCHFVRTELADSPVRIGLTGTVPRDRLKRHTIECHIGGPVLDIVSTDHLMSKNYVSSIGIEMISTLDQEMEAFSEEADTWTWDREFDYLNLNKDRIESIAQYIKSLDPKNTLVLCHPQLGKQLASHFEGRMIADDTPLETREGWFKGFDDSDDFVLCASYGTSGTGISINRIFRLFLIDVGKNEVYIRQGIGRGLRLDGDINHCDVIDISADTKYSKRHRKERIKIYKREKFQYVKSDDAILVKHD